MSKFQATIHQQDGSFVVVVNNNSHTVSVSHPNYIVLRNAVKEGNVQKFLDNIDVVTSVKNAFQSTKLSGRVSVQDGAVLFDNEPVHNTISTRILDMIRGGFSITPLVRFLENLMQNPSKHSVDQLYAFLEKEGIPITEDGCFLAYKTVRQDYLDKYSGKFSNKPGTVVSCARNKVDDNPSNHCSYGFHVGGLAYSGPGGWYNSSGDRVVLVKVNPADAVSVPSDHNFTKLRVCRYEVVGDYKGVLNKPVYSGKGLNDDEYSNDEYMEDTSWTAASASTDSSVDWDELLNDDEINFDYEGEQRYLKIESIDYDKELVTGTLLYPETKVGQYRSFRASSMNNIHFTNE